MKQGWRAALVAISVAAAALPAAALAGPPARVGQPAPDFALTTFDKRKLTRADLKGKVVVINYWATWCGPCKSEMPMMSAVHMALKARGLEIFGVTTEDSVPDYKLKKLASVLSYPLVSRFKGSGYPMLDGVPTSYVIDRRGIVRYAKAGSFQGDDFARLVVPLLNEAP
jgi:cytochrome c biogenesis protein CcmG, thiol:disulfide interchange protein DsbE